MTNQLTIKTIQAKFLLFCFFILCLINLWAEYKSSTLLIYATKPFLITLLAVWFWLKTGLDNFFSKLIFAGLFFSVGGDTLLMFVENSEGKENFFLFGLGSFLITHIFYFAAFYTFKSNRTADGLFIKLWMGVPLIIYFGAFNWFLLPGVPDDMLIPVAIYGIAIIGMAISCVNLYGKLSSTIFLTIFGGVLLFVFSDSFIAVNKFQSAQFAIPYVRLWIMVLYLAGQYLIVSGAVQASADYTD